ncbi:lysozyme inhibitor LprI family protein [Jannaschia marina]|uniref:lysozyme inhibitor LprI family protein n=1 Tax=Jannaschia marina TaxID=2741674 RepID=UPI0015C70E92|nr:hypothetical protein [Jannaschia marina]
MSRPLLAAVALAAALLPLPTDAAGPSFDCARAATSTEFAICDSARLSELDVTMAALYRRAAAGSANPDRLWAHQLLWQRWRNICGGDAACLARRYEARILDLAPPGAAPPLGDGPAVTYRIRDGRSERVYPDGRIQWKDLTTGRVGTILPDGSRSVTMHAQVEPDTLPEFPASASAWVAALEAPLLETVDSLLPAEFHDDYRAAQAGVALPDRMFRHVDSIRFLSSE